jgi:hypothetical protein
METVQQAAAAVHQVHKLLAQHQKLVALAAAAIKRLLISQAQQVTKVVIHQ